jgi:hypothetical protein
VEDRCGEYHRKKVLLVGGSLNQTTMVRAVSTYLEDDFDCYFAPFYCDGPFFSLLARLGLLNFSIIGGSFRKASCTYLEDNGLPVDAEGRTYDYDLVVMTTDLLIPRNLRHKTMILIQEGMTDPEGLGYFLVKWLGFPRWAASTAATGLSDAYKYFCVASDGYRELFVRKGVKRDKTVVTGIPNFDNVSSYLDNDFPHRGYVLVATTDTRETFKFDNRKKFIRRCMEIANGRQLIFKLHPNEDFVRSTREIKELAPDALVFSEGNTNHMIANCEVLITQHSSVVYAGLALGKECYSDFDMDLLRELTPIQNGGTSAQNIAAVCRAVLEGRAVEGQYVSDLKPEPDMGIRGGPQWSLH